jgi:hypothetical protein
VLEKQNKEEAEKGDRSHHAELRHEDVEDRRDEASRSSARKTTM